MFNRKKYLINRKFQLNFIRYMIFISLIVTFVFYGTSVYFFSEFRALGMQFALPLSSPFFTFISQQETLMNQILLGSVLSLDLLIVVLGVFYSHRISGPLKHLQNDLAKVGTSAELKSTRFRKNDYFPELADEFNKMVERLKNK